MLKRFTLLLLFSLIISGLSAQIIIRDTVFVKKIIYDTISVYDTSNRIHISKILLPQKIDTSLKVTKSLPIRPDLNIYSRPRNKTIKFSYSLFTPHIKNFSTINLSNTFHNLSLGYQHTNNKWIFGIDLGYYQLQNSGSSEYTYVSFSREQYYDDDTINEFLRPYITTTNQIIYSNISFLEIPISIKYKFFDTKIHLIPSVGLNTSIRLKSTTYIYDSIQNNLNYIDDDVKPLSFSLQTGLGIAYQINPSMLIAIEPNINIGLSSLIASDKYFLYSINRYGISVYYTYRF